MSFCSFPRRNKYRNVRVKDVDGLFDSKGEHARWQTLLLLARGGAITDLSRQPMVLLTNAKVRYRPDFLYTEKGRKVWEDFKGVETTRFRLIKRLWQSYGPGLLRITKRRGERFVTVQEVYPVARP